MRQTSFPRDKFSTRLLASLFSALSLAMALTLASACAKQGSSDKGKSKYSREACPNIFVAELFSTKDILDELRDSKHQLSFTKVTAVCKLDKQGVRLLDLSFSFLLEPGLSKHSSRRRLLLPLFAVASIDEKTIVSRVDKFLSVRFTASGRAEGRWLLALPSNSSALPSQTKPSSPNFSLYLGFDGADSPFALQDLLEKRG